MSEKENSEDQQISLLKQLIGKLEDIRILFEKVYIKGTGAKNEFVWLSNKQLEKQLGVTERTLQAWRDNGSLGFSKVGNRIFYNKNEVEQMLWNKFKTAIKLK